MLLPVIASLPFVNEVSMPRPFVSMHRLIIVTSLFLVASGASRTLAHDTWVQTANNSVRPNDVVHVDFCLGNHGNDHRDFKLASKLSSMEGAVIEVRSPSGKRTPSPNLDPGLVRESSCPYWGLKGFSDEEATQCRADRGLASAG
jgi:5-carboxymethyl-2-hydroxymuconate isomerase